MDSVIPNDLVPATIVSRRGTIRVFIPERDAQRLVVVTDCLVRVEREYAPSRPATAIASRQKAATAGGSLPDRILQRMAAAPNRTFRSLDFADLGETNKRINAALSRLVAETKKIERVESGTYRLLSGTAAEKSDGDLADGGVRAGATSEANVLAFLRNSSARVLNASEVVQGMGLPPDRRGAVVAALKRLIKRGLVQRVAAGQFGLTLEGAQP